MSDPMPPEPLAPDLCLDRERELAVTELVQAVGRHWVAQQLSAKAADLSSPAATAEAERDAHLGVVTECFTRVDPVELRAAVLSALPEGQRALLDEVYALLG